MTKLNPTQVANETEALDVALDGQRRRPVVAIDKEGKLVVCCRRTARKHGWEVQGALFQRSANRTPKVKVAITAEATLAPVVKAPKLQKAPKPAIAELAASVNAILAGKV